MDGELLGTLTMVRLWSIGAIRRLRVSESSTYSWRSSAITTGAVSVGDVSLDRK